MRVPEYLEASNPLRTCPCGNNLKADCSGFGRTDQHHIIRLFQEVRLLAYNASLSQYVSLTYPYNSTKMVSPRLPLLATISKVPLKYPNGS